MNSPNNNLSWLPWLCHVTSSIPVMTSIWNIMTSSDHSKLHSTQLIHCIKGVFPVRKVSQSLATRCGRCSWKEYNQSSSPTVGTLNDFKLESIVVVYSTDSIGYPLVTNAVLHLRPTDPLYCTTHRCPMASSSI